MRKKVIDITTNGKKPDIIPELTSKKIKKIKKSKRFLPRSINIFYLILIFIVICIISVVFLSLQNKMIVTINPLLEPVDSKEEVKVSVSQLTSDFEEKVIPGQFFKTEEEEWNIFQSTGSGEEGGKAEGFVTVYNSHSPARSVVLVEQTRFLSAQEGKTFRVQEKIILPPATNQSGKLVPSSAKVKVVAQEAGESYNISASNFSVPGLAGSELYYSVWAESFEPMIGGFESEVKVVTKEDLETAQESLEQKLEEVARESLKRVIPDGFSLVSDSVFFEDFQSSCFQEQGSYATEFNCYGKIQATGLGFKRSDLRELIKKFITLLISGDKRLSEESLVYDFSSKGSITKSGSIILDINMTGQVYEEINKDVFISQLMGKNKDGIKSMIERDYPQIQSVEIKFWPFWIQSAPKNEEKIILEWYKK